MKPKALCPVPRCANVMPCPVHRTLRGTNGARWQGVRVGVWMRDGHCCVLCEAPVALADAVIDHIDPIANGGTDAAGNLRTLCGPCNRIITFGGAA